MQKGSQRSGGPNKRWANSFDRNKNTDSNKRGPGDRSSRSGGGGERRDDKDRNRTAFEKRTGSKPQRFADRSEDSGEKRKFTKREDKEFRPRRNDEGNSRGGSVDSRPFRERKDDKPFERRSRNTEGDSRPGSRPGGKPFGERKFERGDNKPSFDKRSRGTEDREDARPYRERKTTDKGGRGDKPAFDRRSKSSESNDRPFRERKTRDEGDREDTRPFRERKTRDEGEREDTRSFRERNAKEGERGEKPAFERRKPSESSDSRPFRERKAAGASSDSKTRGGKKTGEKKPKKFGDDIFVDEDRKRMRESLPAREIMPDFSKSIDDDDEVAEKPARQFKSLKKFDESFHKPEAEEVMPLNKFIAHSGECSRRDAAEMVKQGKVKVNGELILDPGHKVTLADVVTLIGKKLTPQKGMVYILLNKPKGFITTNDDPQGRKTVMDLVANSGVERLYPVGRLDRNTTGLLLMTNDGMLAQKLSHPSYGIKKVYHVTLDKPVTKADFEKIISGVELEDGIAHVDELAYLEAKNELGLEIHSGRNRIVRRIFESLGYVVEKLDRVMYAGLTKKNLPRSKWRFLDEREIVLLKHFKS